MRVVIVGGAGFIGTALARGVHRDGHDVLVLDSPRRMARVGDLLTEIECRPFDFLQDDARALLREGDALVHLACSTDPASSMGSFARDAEWNILPSIRLFDAAAAAGVARVVFASSGGTVYGAPGHLPVREDAPSRPLSAYGVSKVAIEHYLSLYRRFLPVSLRIGNPYGTYQLRGTTIGVVARCIRATRDGEAFQLWGDGSVVRDYLAIDDVVAAFIAVLFAESVPAGAYNVGSGQGTSVSELVEIVSDIAGRSPEIHRLDARAYDVPAITLDATRLSCATGWSARTTLSAGIEQMWRAAVAPSVAAG